MTDRELSQLREDVAQIKKALIGNEEFGQSGLVNRVRNVEHMAQQNTEFLNRIKSYVVGASAVAGTVTSVIAWLIANFS